MTQKDIQWSDINMLRQNCTVTSHFDFATSNSMLATGKYDLDTPGNSFVTWTASSEFGTYHLCEQRRFRQACTSVQSRQNLRCSLIQAVSQEEPSDRKPDPWPLWMAGHAQLKFVMTECWKTQIRLTGLICKWFVNWWLVWSQSLPQEVSQT